MDFCYLEAHSLCFILDQELFLTSYFVGKVYRTRQIHISFLRESKSQKGEKILPHEISHKPKSEFACDLMTWLIRPQYSLLFITQSYIFSCNHSINMSWTLIKGKAFMHTKCFEQW